MNEDLVRDQQKANDGRLARWAQRRWARAQRRREAQAHRPSSANEDVLRAEVDLNNNDRYRGYGKIFGGG
jgi:hypothetical protein